MPESDPTTSARPVGRRSQPLVAGLATHVGRYAVVLVLVLMVVGFTLLLPGMFLTRANFGVMVDSQAILLLLALAATITLRNNDFDLSIASTLVLSAAVAGTLSRDGQPMIAALLAGLAVGVVIGVVNGLLVVKAGLNSFVTTLGMSTAITGVTMAVTDSTVISQFGDDLTGFARGEVLGFPAVTWIGWLGVVALWYVYQRTATGRFMLFIGGNRDAAVMAGVAVARIRVGSYVAAATVSALAGVLLAGYLGAVDPGIGGQYLLQPFAAAFLGATTIHVGRFNAFGTLVALYVLIVGITGLQLYGVPFWVSDVFNGVALVLAVGFARFASKQVQS